MIDWCNVQDKLYDKRDQLEQLLTAYRRQTQKVSQNSTSSMNQGSDSLLLSSSTPNQFTNELVLITGPSGVGKTELALRLQEQVEQDGGHFVRGKFEQPTLFGAEAGVFSCQVDNSYCVAAQSPFATALSQYATSLIRRKDPAGDELDLLQIALERELDSSEVQVLAESIPALRPILFKRSNNSSSTISNNCDNSQIISQTTHQMNGWRGLQGPDAEKYYRHIVSKFVTAIRASSNRPLVILLDDMQWADARSLDVLKMMLNRPSSNTMTGLLVLATIRSDPTASHESDERIQSYFPLPESFLDDLRNQRVATTHVSVSNLSRVAVHELVGDLLRPSKNDYDVHYSQQQNALISDTVFRQTGGNVFFVFQLLSFWEQQGFLLDTPILPAFLEETISSVFHLVLKKLRQLPRNVQEVLKMAACMGTSISERLLKEAGSVGMSPLAVEPALALAHKRGLIVQDTSVGTVGFVHDVIQQAAYSLIPESERATLHLHIGRALWIWLAYDELDRHIFLVTNHITRGLHLVDDPIEKEELAELFLRAGQKAAQSSAFSQASVYYETGISLSGRKHWRRHYRLSLDLYNAAAEVEYYGGNLTRVDLLLNSILKHATSLDDKLHAYYTQIYSLASRDDTNRALSIGFEVLQQLGVAFPDKLRTLRTRVAWHCCLQNLQGLSDDEIMNLPVMQDNRQLMIMRLLNTLMMSASSARQELVVPLLIRMVNRTLQFGICGESCIGIGYLGSYMGRQGRVEDGDRFVQLGLRIMEKFDAKEWQSRLALGVYGGFYTTRHPMRESIKPLLAARRAGLVVGDIHSSWVCSSLQWRVSLFAGVPLPDLLEDVRKCRRVCVQYGQSSADMIFTHKEQFCLNLMGKSLDPMFCRGDEEETAGAFEGNKRPRSLAKLLLLKHMLEVYFNEFEAARATAARFRALKVDDTLELCLITLLFFEGLTAVALSQTKRNEIRRAQHICKRLRVYQNVSPENFSNKVCLLEAEIAAANGEDTVALSKYEESISTAGREGFLHEQAFACERAGYALLEWGRVAESRAYLEQACTFYEQWGAHAKVVQVQQYLP